jgi:hypothetical protein
LWAQARTSTSAELVTAGALPAAASMTIGSARNGDLRELARELPVDEVLRALLDEPERGGVPERGRAAIAEHHLIAVGQREQLSHAGTHAADERPDRLLAMRRAEHRGAVGEQALKLGRADLRRAAAKAAVARLQIVGNRERRSAGGL